MRETEAVVFVACTPNAELQKLLQAEEDRFIATTKLKRIRIVERGGTKLKDLLCSRDPWEGKRCEREDCLPCSGDENEGAGISCQKKM